MKKILFFYTAITSILLNSQFLYSGAATYTVDKTADNGAGSLRQAILDSNANAGPWTNRIQFDIPVSDPGYQVMTDSWRIIPLTVEPSITQAVEIDGYSYPGAVFNTATPNTAMDGSTNAVLKIEIHSNYDQLANPYSSRGNFSSYSNTYGLRILSSGAGSIIKGLCINGFVGAGIRISADNTIIQGNFLGTDITGTQAIKNINAIFLQGSNNLIGGPDPEHRNLLVGSAGYCDQVRKPLNGCIAINDIVPQGRNPVVIMPTIDNVITGNLIGGLDKTGLQVIGETSVGICINGSIRTEISNNIISANQHFGVVAAGFGDLFLFTGNQETHDTIIENNLIGTDKTGLFGRANGTGIYLEGACFDIICQNNTIGSFLVNGIQVGTVRLLPPKEPPFSFQANGQLPIEVPRDTVIQNNLIGLDALGAQALANQDDGYVKGLDKRGIYSASIDTQITHNVISGIFGDGIWITEHSTGNQVTANFIGLDLTGTSVIGNSGDGIRVFSPPQGKTTLNRPPYFTESNFIGDGTVEGRNIIAGNGRNGILLDGYSISTAVDDNYIGTSVAGVSIVRSNCAEFGNNDNGVDIDHSSDNLVQNNLITQNGKAGVAVISPLGSLDAVDNVILTNSTYNNGGLGIDLEPNGQTGVTPNDPKDVDLGPNRLQNFPCLKVRRKNDTIQVSGTLNSLPNATFLIQFFDTQSLAKIREGQTFIGELQVTTNAEGNAYFSMNFPLDVTCGIHITATATWLDADGNPIQTSEFGRGGLCLKSKECRQLAKQCGCDQGCERPAAAA